MAVLVVTTSEDHRWRSDREAVFPALAASEFTPLLSCPVSLAFLLLPLLIFRGMLLPLIESW
jgi:hypothetical protein